MATVIRATDQKPGTSSVAFNFDDMAAQAKSHLDQVRAEAVKIVAEAQQEAADIRRRAELGRTPGGPAGRRASGRKSSWPRCCRPCGRPSRTSSTPSRRG